MDIEQLEPVPGWVARRNVRHDRLVWLAARPHLERIHRKWWHTLTRALRANNNPRRNHRIPGATEKDDLSASLQRGAVIVDGLAGRFTPEEQEVVRRTGLLPNWFWPAYLEEFDRDRRR